MRTKQYNITKSMKKVFLRLFCCTIATLMIYACADETDYEYTSDCTITSFTLGNITRTMHTTNADGEDSTYTITYSGSYYPMTIDQVNLKIYNQDSLPYGSSVSSVLATVGAYGQVAYRETGFEDGVVPEWKVYSSSDSIDFSKPVIFRVVSYDGKGEKDYEVQVNVAKREEKALFWAQDPNSNLEGMQQIQAIVMNDSLLVLGIDDQSNIIKSTRYIGPDSQKDISWKACHTEGAQTADIRTLQLVNDKLYLSTSAGQLLTSDNGQVWTEIFQTTPIDRLVGNDGQHLYAIINGSLCSSTDEGLTWNKETLDVAETWLPTVNVASIYYAQSNGIERMLIAGSRNQEWYPNDPSAMIFGKILNTDDQKVWMYYNTDSYNHYALPRLENLHLVSVYDMLIAFGGSITTDEEKPLETLYISTDNGITWKPGYNDITSPTLLDTTTDSFSGCTDSEGRFWLLSGKQVWKATK